MQYGHLPSQVVITPVLSPSTMNSQHFFLQSYCGWFRNKSNEGAGTIKCGKITEEKPSAGIIK